MKPRLLFWLAAQKGHPNPGALTDWHGRPALVLILRIATRAIRGLFCRFRLGSSSGTVFCEKGVRLYHPSGISTGAGLNLEEGCEIVGLAKQGIQFGEKCTVGRFATIRPTNVLLDEAGEGMRMGSRSNIGPYSYIGCSGQIDIGSDVMMGPRVNLLAENHDFDRHDAPIREQGVTRGTIRIEDNCWIGANSTILANVTVGTGSIVAAGAVVTHDVPSNSVVGGVPARLLHKRRSSE